MNLRGCENNLAQDELGRLLAAQRHVPKGCHVRWQEGIASLFALVGGALVVRVRLWAEI